MFDIHKILYEWQSFYYTPIIMFITEIITLIIILKKNRNSKPENFFLLFIGFDVIIYVSDLTLIGFTGFNHPYYNTYVRYSNTIISTIELLVYSFYFNKILKKTFIRKTLMLCTAAYTAIVIISLLTNFNIITNRPAYSGWLIYALELTILLPYCLLYYISIFTNKTADRLSEKPSFWLVTGLLIYSCLSIPSQLIHSSIHLPADYFILGSFFFYLPITINFICIAKAFLCKKPLTI